MGEWLWWTLGSVCVLFAALKIVGGVYCLVVLISKWRSIPELWGIDWLDIVFRVEREFGVTLSAADFESWPAEARVGLTAGRLWDLVAAKLREKGSDVPVGGWKQFVTVLCEALNVKAAQVTSESRLYADLDMVYGVD